MNDQPARGGAPGATPRQPAGSARGGQFVGHARTEADVTLEIPGKPPTPPVYPPPTDLARPVRCPKCAGDGGYTYPSGVPGVCSRCGGLGSVEGDPAMRAARRGYDDARKAAFADAREHSYDAYRGLVALSDADPDRFARALASHADGHPGLMDSLVTYARETGAVHVNPARAAGDRYAAQWPRPPGLDTADGAQAAVATVPDDFAEHLRSRGFDATVVDLRGACFRPETAHPDLQTLDSSAWTHRVVRVRAEATGGKDWYVDWCARRFRPDLAVPWVYDRGHVERLWSAIDG